MNNLKRVLSLALSAVMLVGMMAVGASAATFTDAKDIKNNDAVNFMVALNIINGNDDGSFAPERVVSRAEMAKMITVALNGGKDPVLGTLATPTYSDIKGHWAEKYIEYCSNLGIISGRGDGTFDPAGTVTGNEAAKMVLVAMGYNSNIHGFVGADWALNVASAANSATPNSLYKGLESIDPSAGLSRDNVALLIYNGVQDHMMERSDSITVDDGKVSYGYQKNEDKTILTEKYGYKVGYAFVSDVSIDEDDDLYTVDLVTADDSFGAKLGSKKKVTPSEVTFKDDVSALYGQQVKVVYNDDNEAVGIYAVDSQVLATVNAKDAKKDADDTTIKVDGTTYRFDGENKKAQDIPVYNFLNGERGTENLTTLTANKEFSVDLIDNDGNGRINCAVVHPVKVGKVTYLGKDSISISNGIASSEKLEDMNVYEGVKKNDFVVATEADYTVDGKVAVVKAETVKGTVGATRATSDTTGAGDTDKTNIRIDGIWYDKAATVVDTFETPALNADVELAVFNGFYIWAEADKTLSKDLLVVTALGSKQDFNKTATAKIATMDGAVSDTVTIKLSDDAANDGIALFESNGTVKNDVLGKLFTFEMDGSTYELTLATEENTGYDETIESVTFNTDTDKVGDAFVADDAVVFVMYKGKSTDVVDADYVTVTDIAKLEKASVITGKALKSWAKNSTNSHVYGTAATTLGFTETSNGLDYAKVLVVAFDAKELPGASGSTKYGYVVAKSYQEKDGTKTYTYFDLWNGEEVISVKESGKKIYAAGTAVSYEDLGNDEVGKVTKIEGTAAVTGYNAGDEVIKLAKADGAGTYDIDEDTTILYIDSDAKKGVESEGVTLADKLDNGKYEQNVYYVLKTNHVEAIFVDVNNKIKGSEAVAE